MRLDLCLQIMSKTRAACQTLRKRMRRLWNICMKPNSEMLETKTNAILIAPIEMDRSVPRAFEWSHAESFRTERPAILPSNQKNVVVDGPSHSEIRPGAFHVLGSSLF